MSAVPALHRRGASPALVGLMAVSLTVLVLTLVVGGPVSALSPAPVAARQPRRIVSLNLCTDQLVVMLADRSRIAAITWLARDPMGSVVADEAKGLPITYGAAEEITRLKPDLVIAGRHTTRTTIAMLKRFGYPIVELDPPSTFEAIEAQIVQVAELVGAPDRGARMVDDMRQRLARTRDSRPPVAPVAAVFNSNGGTQGSGTLIDTVIRASGLRNMAADVGVRGFGQLSLERLLLAHPEVIILPDLTGVTLSVTQQTLVHPALRVGTAAARIVRLPGKWTSCGGPWTVDAVEHLQRATR